jgi:putative chitinase
MITKKMLLTIMPHSSKYVDRYLNHLIEAMLEFGIDTKPRIAAFLAQVAHESGELKYVKELASGEAYDTGRKAVALGNTPEADGDGQKYKGRGLIQITGRFNYEKCGTALGLDLIAFPELLELPENVCRSAAWFWASHGLNELADEGEFEKITRKINGGLNGQESRLEYYDLALQELDF